MVSGSWPGHVVMVIAVCTSVSVRGRMWDNVVEHRVDGEEARISARTLQPEIYVSRPGCADCTREELEYCSGNAVLHDHCCCDLRHLENFPYVPHTCYLRPGCRPLAGDCARYTRLRVCCCDRYVAEKWKSRGSLLTLPWRALLIFSTTLLVAL